MFLQNYIEKIRKFWTFKKHIVSKILYFATRLNRNIGRRWILFIPCDSCNLNPCIWLQYQDRYHNVSVVIYSEDIFYMIDFREKKWIYQQWNPYLSVTNISTVLLLWLVLEDYHFIIQTLQQHKTFQLFQFRADNIVGNTKAPLRSLRNPLYWFTWFSTTACTVALVTTGLPM